MNDPDESFVQHCRSLRITIKSCGADVRALAPNVLQHSAAMLSHPPGADLAEAGANLTLAYRHLEDAAMRLGKAIQAYDGGISVYDK